jgi:hypothetical protein
MASFAQSATNNGGTAELYATRFTTMWSAPAAIGAGDVSPPSEQRVALAPDGSASVSFLQADGVKPRVWVTSATPASVWSAPAYVDLTGGALPDVTLAANGHAVVTWVESKGPSTAALWASRNAGAGWTMPVLVSADTGLVGQSIRVVADASGNTTAVWTQMIASRAIVRSARLNDASGAWSTPVSLSSGMRDASVADLAGDSKGNAVAVWYETNDGVHANRFNAATASWAGPVDVATKLTQAVSGEPRVAIGADGDAIAVWTQIPADMAAKRVFAAHSTSTGWGTPVGLMTDPNAYTTEAAVIAVNASGEATAVWQQQTDSPAAVGIWASGYR